MAKEIESRGKGKSGSGNNSALNEYREFLPSQVQRESWSSRFVLFVENLSVSFDGFKAVDIPCYGVRHGELRVVIGPNGAGKTTFCDLVSGKTRPSTGKVYYDGREITTMDESDIALRGIGRKFQTPTVFDSLTTYENLLNIVLDPEYGDITDANEGTDIRIEYGKKSGQSFPTTDIRPMRKTSPLAESAAKIEEILANVPDTTTAFERVSAEDCEKVLRDTLNTADTATPTTETSRYSNTSDTSTTSTTGTDLEGVSDIESAFDDLLA